MKRICFKGGYKYQLEVDYEDIVFLKPSVGVTANENAYIQLSEDGELRIKEGYAWDGPSGPTYDSKNFMRGSLVHDAMYQLIREGFLGEDRKNEADLLLREMCREDGMSWIRASWVYRGLKWFGGPAADPANKKQPVWAP